MKPNYFNLLAIIAAIFTATMYAQIESKISIIPSLIFAALAALSFINQNFPDVFNKILTKKVEKDSTDSKSAIPTTHQSINLGFEKSQKTHPILEGIKKIFSQPGLILITFVFQYTGYVMAQTFGETVIPNLIARDDLIFEIDKLGTAELLVTLNGAVLQPLLLVLFGGYGLFKGVANQRFDAVVFFFSVASGYLIAKGIAIFSDYSGYNIITASSFLTSNDKADIELNPGKYYTVIAKNSALLLGKSVATVLIIFSFYLIGRTRMFKRLVKPVSRLPLR